MNTSPLQLDASVVSRLNFEADPEFQPDEDGGEVKVDVSLDSNSGESESWRIRLTIAFGPKSKARSPYRGELEVHGYFHFSDDSVPSNEAARLVAVNGASMLYSGAREYLLLVTSRGPWPPIRLPTVSFRDIEVVQREPETDAAPQSGGGNETAP